VRHNLCSLGARIIMNDSTYWRIAEEVTDLAILVLDESGHVVLWNAGAQAIFGWSADEVRGRSFELLFIDGDRDRGVPAAELEKARTLGRSEDTRWHLRSDGRLVFLDGFTIPIRDAQGLSGFAKFARDKTEKQRTEQRLAAQLALTSLLNEERPFEATAQRIMQIICENLEWDMGALWEVRGDAMACVEQWHSPRVNPEHARALCEGQSMRGGEGLIGVAWDSREAVWLTNFVEHPEYPRAALAERAGIQGAFAFPITGAGRVIGAMEFFSAAPREPDQSLLPVMTLIGSQLGEHIERRRITESLRESEERYRVVSETAQDAIFTMDESSVVLFCNPAVERMFGYAPDELTGRKLDIIIPERFREQHYRGIERFLRTRRRRIPWTGVELPALHKDGHEFPCEISFGEWTADGHTIFTGFARDVTERKRALEKEQQARADAEAAREQLERRAEEEASFRRLASALTGAVEMADVLIEITNRATLVTRADGVYVERIVPQGDARVVEVVAAAGKGTPARGLRVEFPGSMTDEIMKKTVPVILADMKGLGRHMAPYLSDSCRDCQVLVTPLLAEEEPLGALVLLNSRASGRSFGDGDVVRARTLGDLASLALRRVRLMEQEREAKEKAEAAVRVRDETLGIVSHDLRNPLTKIALSADLLREVEAHEQRELIDTILSSTKQMQRLIQDLLDVARVESGALSVAQSPIDPAALVREVCASNEPLAEQKRQRIVCHIPEPLPHVCADRERMMQVFGNLIGNAMKFTPERGTITVEVRQTNGDAQFVVRDSGPGIPESDLKHVFTPYWQAKKTAHMGAGLGLAIVRGIVEAHGGRVWAENAPNGGAVFRFTIPVA
jgi:PAS domain S-box-containing protein